MRGVLLRRGVWPHRETPRRHAHRGKTMEDTREDAASCRPRRGLSRNPPATPGQRTSHLQKCETINLEFRPPIGSQVTSSTTLGSCLHSPLSGCPADTLLSQHLKYDTLWLTQGVQAAHTPAWSLSPALQRVGSFSACQS